MSIPVAIPLDILYYFVALGALCVVIAAVGALLRLWGWKWVTTVAGVFITIAIVVILISWLFERIPIG